MNFSHHCVAKSRRSFTGWVLFCVLMLSPAHQTTADVSEKEPNNSRTVANIISLDATNQGRVGVARINTLSDVDYFKITTPSVSGPLELTVTMTPTSADRALDAKVELLDASGSFLGSKDTGYDNAAEMLTVPVTENTTYYIRCTSADSFSSGSGDYTLSVRVAVPQMIASAYWLAPNRVTEGAGATARARVTGFNVGDQFTFEIREDDGLLCSDYVTSTIGVVYSNAGNLFVDATWKTVWQADQSGDPEFYFIVSRGAVSKQSGTTDADEMHVAIGDRDDQIGEATNVVAMTQTRSITGKIDLPTDVDMYAFTVVAGQKISFDIDQRSGSLAAYLRVFDAGGNEVAHDTGGIGPGEASGTDAYLEFEFPVAGTFYVGVSGAGNGSYDAVSGEGDASGSTGAYTLVLSPGIAGKIHRPNDTTEYLVDLLRFGTNPMPIDPNLRTWIVIHGWRSARTEENISTITATLVATRPEDQILTLDWREAADTINPFPVEDSIVPVAEWAAAVLKDYGFRGTNLNLVGHSFGSYVADELAERVGGVDSIVALDAAENIVGGYDPEDSSQVNFARDSLFSWAFHSSTLGSGDSPTTADEAFVVTGGETLAWDAHSDVVYLFAYMLAHPTDSVGQFFQLPRLLAGILGPWLPNQFFTQFFGEARTGGYEADIVADYTGRKPLSIDFVPRGPEIFVLGNGIQITTSDSTPSLMDGTDFGMVQQGQAGPARTFTVRNDGGSALSIGTILTPTGFGLSGQLPTRLDPGASASFTVQLDTKAAGTRSGQISISNNDPNKNPFTFSVIGVVSPTVATPPTIKLVPDPRFALQVEGAAGATHTIESANRLTEDAVWQEVRKVVSGETWYPATEMAQEFFRVREP